MRRTLKDRILGWLGAISCTEANTIANRLLRVKEARNKRLMYAWHQERAKAKGLERRVEELEPALAECVAGLREIAIPAPGVSPLHAARYRHIASKTLDRLQIPDDHLPTKGYAR